MVVHTASDYVSMDQLQSDFITSFMLGNISECVYIVNIDSILGPLFVFKNYGSVGEDTNKCFCSIPQENGVNISVIGYIDSIPQLISYLFNIKYRLTEPFFL